MPIFHILNVFGKKINLSLNFFSLCFQFKQQQSTNSSDSNTPQQQQQQSVTSCIVASGPYRLQGSDNYQGLDLLFTQITKKQYKVGILIGPFIDCSTSEDSLNSQSNEDIQSQFASFCESLSKFGVKNGINFVLIPSPSDRYAFPVYPQISYKYLIGNDFGYSQVHFFSNPCTICIGGISIMCNAADSLISLATTEHSGVKSQESKIDRLLAEFGNQKWYF